MHTFPAFLPLSINSVIYALPLCTDVYVLSAVMLKALLLCALGAPVENEPTDSPAGDTSGEEEPVPSDLLSASPIWDSILGTTSHHQKEVSASPSRNFS